MKLRTILGLAAVGGVAYAHKQRGGTFTLDSFKESARALATTLVGHAMKVMAPPQKPAANTSTARTSTYAESKRRFDDDNLH